MAVATAVAVRGGAEVALARADALHVSCVTNVARLIVITSSLLDAESAQALRGRPERTPRGLDCDRLGGLFLLQSADFERIRLPGTIASVKVRGMIELLEADGWSLVATRGSHRQFKHTAKPGRVTVAGKLSDDLHPKTRTSILRQAGLRR